MGLADFILFPLYVALFYLLFALRRKRIQDPILRKYHLQGFWIKVGSCIAFTIFSYYISVGDSTSLYYREGLNIYRMILKDFNNIKIVLSPGIDFDDSQLSDTYNSGYFESESNFFIARLVTILSFITFGKYSVINLFFSMISYSGVWRLYKFFYEQYPHLHKKIALAVIYLPTFVFWSSGILKDPICTGMMGWLTYAAYAIFYKKEDILKNTLIVIVSGWVLAIVKIYILISYGPFLVFFLILKNMHVIKNTFAKLMLGLMIVVCSIAGFFFVTQKLQEELGFFAVSKLAESMKTQQNAFINLSSQAESSFSLGVEFDGSLGSLARIAPAAIVATLYRPYLWESKKVSTLLSSLESLVMLWFTLYVLLKAGFINFFRILFTNVTAFYGFAFAVLFALFIGATTLNFGTLVRYKIPCMPFYLMALFLIQDTVKKQKALLSTKEF